MADTTECRLRRMLEDILNATEREDREGFKRAFEEFEEFWDVLSPLLSDEVGKDWRSTSQSLSSWVAEQSGSLYLWACEDSEDFIRACRDALGADSPGSSIVSAAIRAIRRQYDGPDRRGKVQIEDIDQLAGKGIEESNEGP